MSFLRRMTNGLSTVKDGVVDGPLLPFALSTSGVSGRGPLGFVVEKGERYGTSLALGMAKGYYGERFTFKGHGYDLWGGAALTVLSTMLTIFSRGRSEAGLHLGRVGDAGMQSWLNSMGAAYGMQHAGRSVAVLAPGNAQPKIAGDSIGMIPPVTAGAWLDKNDFAKYASPR